MEVDPDLFHETNENTNTRKKTIVDMKLDNGYLMSTNETKQVLFITPDELIYHLCTFVLVVTKRIDQRMTPEH